MLFLLDVCMMIDLSSAIAVVSQTYGMHCQAKSVVHVHACIGICAVGHSLRSRLTLANNDACFAIDRRGHIIRRCPARYCSTQTDCEATSSNDNWVALTYIVKTPNQPSQTIFLKFLGDS